MKFRASPSSPHPSAEVLALYSRGDVPLLARLRLRAHLQECAPCEQELKLIASATAELRREAATETLTAFEAIADWGTLEREMLGNIVVGVSAARCVDKVGRKRAWIPKVAVAAGLSALFVAGWLTHIPREQTGHLWGALYAALRPPTRLDNVVETTPNGIAARSDGVTLTILHPASAVVGVSGTSSMEARYVDEQTGQLTITNVYGQ